ncbi:MAG: FAD-dependent oxidoreductase [Alphaproteobacteria bacterium]|nr:FAD-dependent oxidoreductase [Alphaproteobacteria bacterium]
MKYDVIVIGGGLHGCSTAYHLIRREPGLRIAVVERDPSYEHAASIRSTAGLRIMFSQEENVRMSQYGHAFYRGFEKAMAVDGEPASAFFRRQGYLFLASSSEATAVMRENHTLQTGLGCHVDLLDAAGLAARFPSLRTEDVLCATHSPDDGWIDSHAALMSMRRKMRTLGVSYVTDAVAGLEVSSGLVRGAVLESGERLEADLVVNNAGAWAHEIAAMIGLDIPVRPMPRTTWYFECRAEIEPMPLTIDEQTIGFRPEGAGFIAGTSDYERAGSFDWEPDLDAFDSTAWPHLAHRLPAFEAVRLRNAWACHYAYNMFDGNMIIGAWPGAPENFLIATGFSGHGLQHAPAAGRALSELILDGGFTTIDLDRFHCRRVPENRREPERGVTA